MINKKNTSKIYILFIISHLIIWTAVPTFTNINLPLDTIEALAWGSNLEWGFNKHPPFSAFAVELFFYLFGSNDWAYYLLSQIFLLVAFIYVWKLSNKIFNDKVLSLLSVLILESIFFYNYTTPEFNVNVSQIPFWALSVYYFWKCVDKNKIIDWVLLGIFSALGFLSKYLFIYILFSLFLYFIKFKLNNKKLFYNYLISILVTLLILTPHFYWLYLNDFITIKYGLNRSGLDEFLLIDHALNPLLFLIKQFLILIPFFLMIFILSNKIKFKPRYKNNKTKFLIYINLIPIILIFLTSTVTGAEIRTMWMTPFYLFFGVLFIDIIKKNIERQNLKNFSFFFVIFFLLSPFIYSLISYYDDTKRTDYQGKEIARLVQNKWDKHFSNEIKIVVGDEWSAGNLSYHLISRPIWTNDLQDKSYKISEEQGVIYTGNPRILKKICPGVFGTIKPVGYCMIGKR